MAGRSIGFVPTMGALHKGHVSLISEAKKSADVVIASIFVNPTQFNNPEDLLKYPRTIEKDTEMLNKAHCDALFLPTVEEIYPTSEKGHWDFGLLTSSLEGHFRPGHFDGVLTVVKKFFEIIMPDKAFFGEKDFQQLSLIQKMADFERLNVDVVNCPIVREEDGLAMSSRNMRLSDVERKRSLAISRALFNVKATGTSFSPGELKKMTEAELNAAEGIRLEYFEIVDAATFTPLTEWKVGAKPIALLAAYVGDVRLIDNIML